MQLSVEDVCRQAKAQNIQAHRGTIEPGHACICKLTEIVRRPSNWQCGLSFFCRPRCSQSNAKCSSFRSH